MKKVLVIDDAAEVADMVGATLETFGFDPVVALSGHAGVEIAQKELPDLIICDVHMPDLDGYDTLKALRENEATATTPFIFLSGRAERPDVRRGMELGADDYLSKPFTPTELITAVRARLAKKEEFARQAEKRLDEVRGNITLALPHELRTPLCGILGLSSILIEDHQTVTPDEVLDNAQGIHRSALRLQRLIENFLIYAQLELLQDDSNPLRQAAESSFTPIDPLVSEAARRMATQAGREKDLYCDITPCSVRIIGENLKKIVEELTGNAFKFSEAGSPVCVKAQVSQDLVTLSVRDYGRGMTAEQIARIGPHTQFDRRVYEQQGTGLGLIIAKRLTEVQGGRWHIESVPGKQTTVSLSFPCAASTLPPTSLS
ncbi:MAG: hybrid sensor histidine kinase/response regulator [Verrucomicrobia bacterium]|nr:hybrid sensor histidine kinase/response regulator [Verrucomicrobiota bacterium]